ncbi:hypothetical protein [Neisseria viridiae]|uniref:hypothetical protein n=1 Tax=Neisseria viridiae TaxID=2830648 RepID=UPI00265863AB|nr:hypothetical protein [Neisseria viridiae]
MENAAASPAGRFRRQRRTQKTVRLRLQQSDRYRRRAFAVFSKPFASSTRPPRDAAV